jgi:hypothetical protein
VVIYSAEPTSSTSHKLTSRQTGTAATAYEEGKFVTLDTTA